MDSSEYRSYRESHCGQGKGEQYDSYYLHDPWQNFMWRGEQECIEELWGEHFTDRSISLLDFACGTGRISAFLEDRVSRSVGVDISDSMLSEARRKLERTELLKFDLTREDPLNGEKFDLVTAFRFFTNAEDDLRVSVAKLLAEHLEEGGYLLFNNHHVPGSPYYLASRFIQRVRSTPPDPRIRLMSSDEMYELVDRAGLRVVDRRHVGFLHLPRVDFPESVVRATESVVTRFDRTARRCESVMLLCAR